MPIRVKRRWMSSIIVPLVATRRGCGALLLGGVIGHVTTIHAADRPAETSAILTVRDFLDSLPQRDLSASSKFLIPGAQAYRIRQGKLVISSIEDVLKGANEGNGKFGTADRSRSGSELIDAIEARVFQRIATVWTRYRVFANGRLHHIGNTVYSLVEQDERWLITNITDEATKLYT